MSDPRFFAKGSSAHSNHASTRARNYQQLAARGEALDASQVKAVRRYEEHLGELGIEDTGPRGRLIARLREIAPGHTTTVRGVVVTHCSNGTFELETWGRGPFRTVEGAADALLTKAETKNQETPS